MASRLPAAALWIAAVLITTPCASSDDGSTPAGTSPSVAASHTSTGTMAAYDAETRQLTVSSASGSTAFHLASDARVWLGNRRLAVAQLKACIGAQVTVSWSDKDGVRTTHTVRLAADPGSKAP